MLKQASYKNSQISTKAKSFDYGILAPETQDFLQEKAVKIKDLVRQTAQNLLEIGQTLNEVQQELGYGKFRRWLNSEFNWSVSKATKLMQVAQRFKSVNFTYLNFGTSALYLLAAPSTPETAVQEALNLAQKGNSISYSLAKKIVRQHKQSSLSQEDGLDQTVSVEAESEKLAKTSVNLPLSQPDEPQTIQEKPANPAQLVLHRGNKLILNQLLQPEMDMISEIGKAEDEFRHLSEQNFFKKFLGREWWRLKREKDFLSLICCSIDDFWLFNHKFSYLEKISCLTKVVQALESNIRRATDLITYLGGEKFIVALSNTNPQGAKKIAQTIAQSVRQFQIPYPLSNYNRHVTVSLGIAGTVPRPELSLEKLLVAVEKAVLKAQKEGGNCAVITNLEMENLTALGQSVAKQET